MRDQKLTCIGCPLGCSISVSLSDNGEVSEITGNTCKKGEEYARKEVTNPSRVVTSIVKINNGDVNMVSVKTAEDIQEALKDLLGGTIQEMMEAELDEHLGYDEYERSDNPDYRNGVKHKKLRSSYGEIPIDVPQDRDGDFEPQIVPKRKKDISAIEQKIIAMSAKGMTTRQISDIVEDIYGFEVSESMVTAVTNKILPQIEEWQQRPLSAVYPIVFIDAIHFSVRDEHIVKKIAAYIILGVNDEGKKEVLSITIGENESAKYWLGVLNELKNRGVRDILILCADGLKGLPEAISTAYPNTEFQRCIVHMIRNTMAYVSYKDRKELATDLKTIYRASTAEEVYENLIELREKFIKRNINLDNKYFYGFFEDKYFFRYDGCGEAFHKNADYFEVITIHNTNNILTIYPSLDGKFHNNIDLNYILLEDVPTRKLIQIDKFNMRYKK